MIDNWPQFHRQVRNRQAKLLTELEVYPDAVFVAGCQRSGTTLLARLISQGPDFVNYRRPGEDDELVAALTLSGQHELHGNGRFCFQTTYLNDHYLEYRDLMDEQRLIWVLRHPLSVVYSMVYHWKRHALNHLFAQCGLSELSPEKRDRFYARGYRGLSRLERAIHAHNGKLKQVFELPGMLAERLLIIEYDELVRKPDDVLARVHEFISARLDPEVVQNIRSNSLHKQNRLRSRQKEQIMTRCLPLYQRALDLLENQ